MRHFNSVVTIPPISYIHTQRETVLETFQNLAETVHEKRATNKIATICKFTRFIHTGHICFLWSMRCIKNVLWSKIHFIRFVCRLMSFTNQIHTYTRTHPYEQSIDREFCARRSQRAHRKSRAQLETMIKRNQFVNFDQVTLTRISIFIVIH